MSYEYTYRYYTNKYNNPIDNIIEHFKGMRFLKTKDKEYYEVLGVIDDNQVGCKLNERDCVLISVEDILTCEFSENFFTYDGDIVNCVITLSSQRTGAIYQNVIINCYNTAFMDSIFRYLRNTILKSQDKISLNFKNDLGESIVEIIFYPQVRKITLRFKE